MDPPFSIIKPCALLGAVSEAEEDENCFPSTNHIKNFKPGCHEGDE